MSRRLRSAVELVSHIGELGFDLYHHDEKEIAEAVKTLREVNPETFAWLVRALQAQPVADSACCSMSSDPLSDAYAREGSMTDESKTAALRACADPPQQDGCAECAARDFRIQAMQDSIDGCTQKVLALANENRRLRACASDENEQHLIKLYRENKCGDADCEGRRFAAAQTVLKGWITHADAADAVSAEAHARSLAEPASETIRRRACAEARPSSDKEQEDEGDARGGGERLPEGQDLPRNTSTS